jgi:hypothetical protein
VEFDKAFSISLMTAASTEESVLDAFTLDEATQSCIETFKDLSREDQVNVVAKMLDGVQRSSELMQEAEKTFIEYLKD